MRKTAYFLVSSVHSFFSRFLLENGVTPRRYLASLV
jgi:hypothetical protein